MRTMRRIPIVFFAITAALMASRPAKPAEQGLTAEAAAKIAAACVDYARSRDGAVNIWIYDSSGELLHFEQMLGAPPMPPLQEFDGSGFDRNLSTAGGVAIRVRGRTVGTAKANGMGAAGDLGCALAAAKAAEDAAGGTR
jgi:uncharacterized protein GlcG (DUF336 family)